MGWLGIWCVVFVVRAEDLAAPAGSERPASWREARDCAGPTCRGVVGPGARWVLGM